MKNFAVLFFSLIIMALLFWAGTFFGKKNCPQIQEKIVYLPSDTTYIHITEKPDPLIVKIVEKVPEPYAVYDTLSKGIKIDTAKIVVEFLKSKEWDQIFINDSTGYIRLQQVISMNEIQEQTLTYVPPPHKIMYQKIVNPVKKYRFTVGAEYLQNPDYSDLSVKTGILYKEKINVNIGISIGNTKSIGFGYIF